MPLPGPVAITPDLHGDFDADGVSRKGKRREEF
jgi:hypothetical protein